MKGKLLMILSVFIITACNKNNYEDISSNQILEDNTVIEKHKLAFSKILSKAIVANKDLRGFLKSEALKTKDNDFNVIYGFCKNEMVDDKTFRNILIQFENFKGQVDEIEKNIPTITVLIPSLFDNSFSASSWDIEADIPFVATTIATEIPVVYDGEHVMSLKNDEMPGSPVLLVKENERIKKTILTLQSSIDNTSSFKFVDDAFNGLVKTKSSSANEYIPVQYNNPNKFDFEISKKLVDAFNQFPPATGGWQRDHIYYTLNNVPNTKGSLDRTFYECISAIKIKESGLSLMMDQEDPRYNQDDDFDNTTIGRTGSRSPGRFWTDGNFEIQIDVLINDLQGAGASHSKVISVPADQLFGAEYSQKVIGPGRRPRPGQKTFYYRKLIKLHPKFFYCNIPIKEWDLENMGSSWKISVRENDISTVVNVQESVTSKFATNFGIDVNWGVSEVVKLGLKFGGSTETSTTQNISVQRTLSNDFLGDAIVNFWDPVLRTNNPVAGTNIGFVVDMKSSDRRRSAETYINTVNYAPVARPTNRWEAEQASIKASAQNRFELESFNPIISNNYEIIMIPVYKF
ncbi:hypothetical protein ACR777_01920 [Sphingobacterium spiritivorum]|uniref:hypothetical protein n=1 Tax=Sphingobacterium spiritivorum TaxID=258 RepID=UPI003DA5BD5E